MNLWNVTLAVRGHHAARVGPFLRCVRFLFCYLFFNFGPNANYSPAAVVHTDCALLWLSLRTKRAGCVHLKVRAQTSKSFARFSPPSISRSFFKFRDAMWICISLAKCFFGLNLHDFFFHWEILNVRIESCAPTCHVTCSRAVKWLKITQTTLNSII